MSPQFDTTSEDNSLADASMTHGSNDVDPDVSLNPSNFNPVTAVQIILNHLDIQVAYNLKWFQEQLQIEGKKVNINLQFNWASNGATIETPFAKRKPVNRDTF